ncbi:DUF3530 family protein [Marinomonas pollencensis]|uniref:Uncharacterized protein DUF3530 n=1 Tax=Marinomonas pollencensis TaxID=491954 RepID=A0A3E0DPJ1_9GAMM|nr:DUF3530 family protein [Marinomonas pollencensis]REG84876.1 uncharacterized protein DUF3530 [Marinomonas pollencensis]
MKKNYPCVNAKILLGLSLLISTALYSAEESTIAPTTQSPNSTNTSPPKTEKRVSPSPQKTRIQALENNVKQNHLGHQINLLEAQGKSFLTLYRQALTGDSQGCAILLPSDNEHPDWPAVISPLRNTLPEYSWCTLSMEIPDITPRAQAVTDTSSSPSIEADNSLILANQEEVFARLQAAISDLKNKGNDKQIVLIGYGTGAAYALHFLAQNKTLGDALVLINMVTPGPENNYDLAQDLSLIEHPVLDYFLADSASNQRFASWRKQAAQQRKGDTGLFTQLIATDELNSPSEDTQQMVQRVRGFLKQNTAQVEQVKPLPEYKKGLFYESP